MKKRVLQLIGSFHQGGSERQAVALTRMLVADGTFDVFVATLNKEGILLDEIVSIDLPEIPEFKLTSFYNANFVNQVRRCAKFISANKIEIVHTHDFYTNIFGMAAATLSGVKCRIASKRETGGMRTSAQEMIEKLAFGRASAIVVNSEAVRAHLLDRNISADKLNTIYNGIDSSRFKANIDTKKTFESFGLPTDDGLQFVTIVANLRHRVKNIPMLLRAASKLKTECPHTHFVIAGEGELEGELQAMAKDMGIADRVHFIRRCDDVPALLNASTVCVLTSTAEGFANSILEYMAAGKPVVATDVGGAAEAIIYCETGYLVNTDDHDMLATRLMEILADGPVAAKMGEAGRRIIGEKFSVETQLTRTLQLYNDCFNRGSV